MLRAELDAASFQIYDVDFVDIEHIMDTFPSARRKGEVPYDCYRTKELILDVYDRMVEATLIGEPYRTAIIPPPGEGPRYPARTPEPTASE